MNYMVFTKSQFDSTLYWWFFLVHPLKSSIFLPETYILWWLKHHSTHPHEPCLFCFLTHFTHHFEGKSQLFLVNSPSFADCQATRSPASCSWCPCAVRLCVSAPEASPRAVWICWRQAETWSRQARLRVQPGLQPWLVLEKVVWDDRHEIDDMGDELGYSN